MFKRIALFLLTNILIMLTVTIIMSVIGGVFGFDGYTGYLITFSIVAGFAGALISLAMSRMMAKWIMRVNVITPGQYNSEMERFVVEETHRLAEKAGLKHMPEVGIYMSDEVNAFATGPSKKRSLMAVSLGMTEELDRHAISAIIGHEIAHIKSGDMVTMTLLQGVINAVVIFVSRLVAKAASSFVREEFSYLVYIVVSILAEIVFSILASPLVFWHSRHREFKADKLGAQLAGTANMIHALESLQRHIDKVDTRQASIAAFKISGKDKMIALFSTHPPLEKRIEALKKQS